MIPEIVTRNDHSRDCIAPRGPPRRLGTGRRGARRRGTATRRRRRRPRRGRARGRRARDRRTGRPGSAAARGAPPGGGRGNGGRRRNVGSGQEAVVDLGRRVEDEFAGPAVLANRAGRVDGDDAPEDGVVRGLLVPAADVLHHVAVADDDDRVVRRGVDRRRRADGRRIRPRLIVAALRARRAVGRTRRRARIERKDGGTAPRARRGPRSRGSRGTRANRSSFGQRRAGRATGAGPASDRCRAESRERCAVSRRRTGPRARPRRGTRRPPSRARVGASTSGRGPGRRTSPEAPRPRAPTSQPRSR